jgi:hypothetical protein
MPDMTLVAMAYCIGKRTCGPFEVPSSNGKSTYTVTVTPGTWERHCTCKAFEFSKERFPTCKHIERVENAAGLICGWSEHWGGPINKDGECPKCGGEVTYYLTAT